MFKKFLVALLICGGIFSAENFFVAEAVHVTAYEKATVINVSDYVNLRENPSTNSAVLAKIPRDATVEVSGEVLNLITVFTESFIKEF